MNRPATTIAGEIIAAIRINALRGTFAASTPGQIDQWLQPFIDRLNATEATTAMTVPLLSTFACFSGQQDRRWRGIINGPDTEAIADADSREELCRALAGQHEKHEPIATELRLQASQENHDGEPWDTMLTASFVIDQQAAEIARLEAELANASCLQQTVTIASQTIQTQRATIERHQQRYEQLRDANNDTFQRLTRQLAEAREQAAQARPPHEDATEPTPTTEPGKPCPECHHPMTLDKIRSGFGTRQYTCACGVILTETHHGD